MKPITSDSIMFVWFSISPTLILTSTTTLKQTESAVKHFLYSESYCKSHSSVFDVVTATE